MSTNFAELVLSARTDGLIKAKTDLNAVSKAGAATEKAMGKSMRGVEASIERVPTAAKEASLQMSAMDQSMRATSAGGFSNQMRMASMQLSQVGQQTMATGNFVQALAIQLPDLALGFGAVGIMAGVAAGALLPVAVNMVSGASSASDLEAAIIDLTSASDNYISTSEMAKKTVSELSQDFGRFAETVQRTYRLLQGVALESAMIKLNDAVNDLDVSGLRVAVDIIKQGKPELEALSDNYNRALDRVRKNFDLTGAQAVTFLGQLDGLKGAQGPEEVVSAVETLNKFFIEAYGSAQNIPPEMLSMVSFLGEALISAARMASELDGTTESASKTASSMRYVASATYTAIPAISELREQYGASAEAMQGVLDAQNKLAASDASAGISNMVAGISDMTSQLGLGADKIGDFQASLQNIDNMSSLQDQANAMAGLAAHLADANGGLSEMDAETQAVYQSLLDAAVGSAELSHQIALGEASSTNLGAAIARIAPQFAPAIAQANTLARAIAGAVAQFGGLASGLLGLSVTANSVVNATSAVGGFMKGLSTTALSSASRGLAGVANNLKSVFAESQKAGATTESLANHLSSLVSTPGSGGGGGGGAAKALSGEMKEAERAAQLLADTLNRPVISAIDGVSNAIGDWVASGFKSIKELGQTILSTITGAISQVVSFAISNPIKLALGIGGVGAGTVANAGGTQPGGNVIGTLGNLAGGKGILGSIASKGIFGSTGIFGSMGSSIGTSIGSALAGPGSGLATSLGGIGGAIGSVVPILGIAAAAFSFFKKKVTELDAGLRVTVDNMDSLVETFSVIETKRFWGLSKKVRTDYDVAGSDVADPIVSIVEQIQGSVLGAATALGVGSSAFANFAHTLEVSTKDMTEDEAQQAITDALGELGDSFAGMVPTVEDYINGTEGAAAALTRMSTALQATNIVMDTLGHGLLDVSLAGGDMASTLVDLFGGLDAFNTATTAYYTGFYTEQERLDTAIRQLSEGFAALGVSMPGTREEFRQMVEALDITTEYGRQMYAALVSMSSALDQVLPSVANFTLQIEEMAGAISSDITGMLADTNSLMQANETAAALWYRTATTLRDLIAEMRGTASYSVSSAQATAFTEARFQSLLASAKAGDNDAASDLPTAARALIENASKTARTSVELARVEARVMSGLSTVAGVSDVEGARHDVVAGLLGNQVDLLTSVNDYLTSGGALSAEQVDALDSQLGALASAISAAETISYAFLKERLAVTVDLLATANLPADVRRLLANAQDGISGQIDFVTRSDLSPDQKWLALTATSEHIKTVEFIADNSQWSQAAQDVAMTAGGVYAQTVQFIARNLMGADLTSIAITEADNMIKAIRFTAQGLSDDDRGIILNQIGPLQKQINFMLGDNIPDEMQALALDDASAFRRVVSFVAGSVLPSQMEALALSRPTNFARTLNVLAGAMPSGDARALAMDAASLFTRTINIEPGKTVSSQTARLALDTVNALTRTIHLTAGKSLTTDEMRVALAGSSEMSRVVNVTLASGASKTAIQMALGNVNAYQVVVNAALSTSMAGDAYRVVVGQQGTYAAVIEAAIGGDLSDAGKRILLGQQGFYIATIGAALGADVTDAQRALLLNATTAAVRGITISATYGDSLTDAQRALIDAQTMSITKAIVGLVWFENMTTDDWALFKLGSERVTKAVTGLVWFENMTANDWRLFGMGNERLTRAVTGSVSFDMRGPLDWRLFEMETETLTRTIRGAVDLSGLTTRQTNLLDSITGVNSGKITLGGSFLFDPAASFSTWFGSTVKSNINDPLVNLRERLNLLADAIRADTAARADEFARSQQVAALQADLSAVAGQRAGVVSNASDIIGQIKSLEASTGVNLRNGASDARLAVTDAGNINYKATHVDYDAGADIAAFSDAFWASGGLEDQLQALLGQPNSFNPAMNGLRRQITALGAIPAYAMGTNNHPGGLARIHDGAGGEVVELPDKTRVFPHDLSRQMAGSGNDNKELLRELVKLRSEVAGMRDEMAAADRVKVSKLRNLSDMADKDDQIGPAPARAEL